MTTYKYSLLEGDDPDKQNGRLTRAAFLDSSEPPRQRLSTTGSYDLARFREKLRRKLKIKSSHATEKWGDDSQDEISLAGVERDGLSGDREKANKTKWTVNQWIMIVILSLFCFVSTVAYSLLSPFFPKEAKEKELSSMVTGLIFGFYEFVIFLSSPVLGKMISKYSPGKMMLFGGIMSSASSFIFGLLDLMPNGTPFAITCFMVRLFEGLGSSAIMVAAYSLVPMYYPGEISSVNSYLEAIGGLGFMAGPPIGAFLYQGGGFKLPFIIVGVIFFLCSAVSFFILPETEPVKSQKSDYKGLLKNPGVIIVYLQLVAAGIAITYLDPTLEPFLEDSYQLSVSAVGGIFFLWSLTYTISSPLVGKFGDKGYAWSLMIGGNILTAVCYLFLGPSSLLSWLIPETGPLWLVITSLLVMGVGCSGMMILPYQAFLELALLSGYEDNLDTYGLISGLTSSACSMGSFIGPILAGYIYDQLKFHWSTTFCAFFSILPAGMLGMYIYLMKRKGLPYRYDWEAADEEKYLDNNNNTDSEQKLSDLKC